ncbi:rhomboid family intramembrane serine protease [Candidatus Raskinella chloraquaticus]|uniref:Peptidase S54 rhomboid domain-containing protein n=1 Tax=Candidatus Raskinella chloraquaticus TaxID=1951219 RepID=A0A1W9HUE3_9HYPH|nr:MAG: hypothetical protein A4S15_12990 [Proteobacteria bacterium SG_bin8]
MDDMIKTPPAGPANEPFFNLPGVIVALSGVMIGLHGWRQWIATERDEDLILRFSFIPLRYSDQGFARVLFADDQWARLWSPITYGLLHGDWQHVLVNTLWLVVFGSAVAWRFGPGRFLLFSLLCSVGGAAAHFMTHVGEAVPVVGASAAISGLTAAACRFVFEAGAPLGGLRGSGALAFQRPAPPLLQSLSNPRIFGFVALWFALTIVFGSGIIPSGLEEGTSIAWEAHLGGFLAGLALFPLFDPILPRRLAD